MTDRHPVYADLAKLEKLYVVVEAIDRPRRQVEAAAGAAIMGAWGWWFGLFMPPCPAGVPTSKAIGLPPDYPREAPIRLVSY